jgi:seryl-tRNA synthetase
MQECEDKEKELISTRDSKLVLIGNLVHDSVPVSDDEVG